MRHIIPTNKSTSSSGFNEHPSAPWWTVLRDLRHARQSYGLKARHLNTLAALLSFLPKDDHRMLVFASNRSITERLNGLCERTFQRHIADLTKAGLLVRRDSANGKRFRISYPGQDVITYGFDLSPLMVQAEAIAGAAQQEQARNAHLEVLRQKILHLLHSPVKTNLDPAKDAEIRLALRRQEPPETLEAILAHLQPTTVEGESDVPPPTRMSASNSQNVGHYQESNKEDNDRDYRPALPTTHATDLKLLLNKIITSCPSALTWLASNNRTWHEILCQAPRIANWIGISTSKYNEAMKVIGAEKAAATVFAVIECAPRIRQPAAYFHSLTVGARSKGYRVDRFLDQIYEHGMSTMGNMTAGAGQSHPRMTQAASVM